VTREAKLLQLVQLTHLQGLLSWPRSLFSHEETFRFENGPHKSACSYCQQYNTT